MLLFSNKNGVSLLFSKLIKAKVFITPAMPFMIPSACALALRSCPQKFFLLPLLLQPHWPSSSFLCLNSLSPDIWAHLLSLFSHVLKMEAFSGHSLSMSNLFQLISSPLPIYLPSFMFLRVQVSYLFSLWSIVSHQKASSTREGIG